jgi:glyoxylase-like metal-dependent hydrolase (beta-lactamase superfamily II)
MAMPSKQIVPGVYQISLGIVNAFLIDREGLTLIDTGTAGSADRILQSVRAIGKQPEDIDQIIVTHCHGDHAGSLAALKQATGAPAYMHPLDAALVREGQSIRHLIPSPGILPWALFRLFLRSAPRTIAPAEIEHELHDGQVLPFAGGLQVYHAPGHSAGQVVLLLPEHGGLLFAADSAGNVMRLDLSLGYEDIAEGRRALARLSQLVFQSACFGHGSAITHGASQRFKEKWAAWG